MRNRCLIVLLCLCAVTTFAAAPAKKKATADLPPNPKKLDPPPGIPVPDEVKAELQAGAVTLGKAIATLQTSLQSQPALLELLPDVQIYHNAVQYALDDDIFYNVKQFKTAQALLQEGMKRAEQLKQGTAPWNTATGLVVRGYVSRIDGSVQPYGLVVPPTYKPTGKPYRLDFWYHGRGDTLSELAFIEGRERSVGEFAPPETFVLHPYGRFMNSFKFAGETDSFEALAHAQKHYPIDPDRICIRGFSMGGAGSWHVGAHYAGLWAAVNPGAGFVDVKNYQKLGDKLSTIPWYEQKLWHVYDSLDYVINLENTTLVAYSGELDTQKAAADLMEKALAADGVKMTHIIGPNTEHKYEPEAKKVVASLVDAAAIKGRNNDPQKIHFVTYTLKYNQMHWVTVDALAQHYEQARVDAEITGGKALKVSTHNVAALTLSPAELNRLASVNVDGTEINVKAAVAGKIHLEQTGGKWAVASATASTKLSKRHNLQGPIDDAFMEPFLMVRPTGKPLNAAVGKWVESEMKDALFQWRRQFRGAAQVKDDGTVTDADIASHNLILWGDPNSNSLLAKIADRLPIRWTASGIVAGGKTYDVAQNAPVLIYPNPLNPNRYIVINSGFTFPQYGTGSNSQQTPKLPDWAVLDLSVPIAQRLEGKGVVNAGFFGEHWEWSAAKP